MRRGTWFNIFAAEGETLDLQVEILRASGGTLAISLTGPVLLRSSRDACRVIHLQDHSLFWQETPCVSE